MAAAGTRAAGMARPSIKPEHAAYRTADGSVRIGGVIHGIGAEIEDPDGWVWTLIQTMDGTREPADVVTAVTSRHPSIPEADVAGAMEQLLPARRRSNPVSGLV
jgi:hypothetical protein